MKRPNTRTEGKAATPTAAVQSKTQTPASPDGVAEQSVSGNKPSAVFRRMEGEVQLTLAVLDLFASGLAEMHEANAKALNGQTAARVAGYRALASGAADDLFRHWQAACADANQMGKRSRVGIWPAWSNLNVSVAEAGMLMGRFGCELEGHALESDEWTAQLDGREPGERFGYYTLGQDRADALRREFDLAWDEWDALDKASEQRAAA